MNSVYYKYHVESSDNYLPLEVFTLFSVVVMPCIPLLVPKLERTISIKYPSQSHDFNYEYDAMLIMCVFKPLLLFQISCELLKLE